MLTVNIFSKDRCTQIGIVVILYILSYPFELRADQEITVKWDNNDSPVIAGYRVHYRHILETSEKVIDVGKNHSAVLRNLTPESRYSCSVRAYDADNFESEPSNEITFVTDLSAPTFASSSAGLGMRISGRPGRNVEVYGSSDLVHWTLLTTVVNVTGTLDLVGLAGLHAPARPGILQRGAERREFSRLDGWPRILRSVGGRRPRRDQQC